MHLPQILRRFVCENAQRFAVRGRGDHWVFRSARDLDWLFGPGFEDRIVPQADGRPSVHMQLVTDIPSVDKQLQPATLHRGMRLWLQTLRVDGESSEFLHFSARILRV